MEYFKFDNLDYPKDSIYAEVMCKYIFAPSFSSYSAESWEKTKAFATEQNMTPEELDRHLYKERFEDETKPTLSMESLDQVLTNFLKSEPPNKKKG